MWRSATNRESGKTGRNVSSATNAQRSAPPRHCINGAKRKYPPGTVQASASVVPISLSNTIQELATCYQETTTYRKTVVFVFPIAYDKAVERRRPDED